MGTFVALRYWVAGEPPHWNEPTDHERHNLDLPRSVRNRNPGNIRKGNKWVGLVSPKDRVDRSFDEFVSYVYGYRALLIVLRNYIRRHKKETLSAIIRRWAPESDSNNPEAYIKRVSRLTGFGSGKRFNANDNEALCSLAYAISNVEAGGYVGRFRDVTDAWNLI